MKKRVAVVFDSAGTLLHMYRVAKEMSTGSILEDIQTTVLVAEKANQALVVIRTCFDDIMRCDPDMKLHDFIEQYDIDLAISCSSSPFRLDDVYGIIKENQTKLSDLSDVVSLVKDRCPNVFYIASGFIVDSREKLVSYVLSTGGQMYSKTAVTIKLLKELGIDIYIASGDGAQNLKRLASSLDIPMRDVFAIATTHDKEAIVENFKRNYDFVVMVGDGMNDILALKAADMGILSSQQGDERPQALVDAADITVHNIIDVVDIVKNVCGCTTL